MNPTLPELPTLQSGIQILQTDKRSLEALHTLVLDHLFMNDGIAYWVDSHSHARTTSLAKLAPSHRILNRIQVARGFTAYQHYSLIDDLTTHVTDDVSLVVAPELDYLYRGDDLSTGQSADMVDGIVDRLTTIENTWNVPILVTLEEYDELTERLKSEATSDITCELTKYGPRFTGNDFETLVYPVENGIVQTTITYWQEILKARIQAQTPPQVEVGYGAD